MRRRIVLISLFFVFIFALSNLVADVFAQQKKPKDIIVTTTDIKEDYEILGIVSIRSGDVNLGSINEKLKGEAKKLGAEYVLMVRYFQYTGYIYAYGTAVKIKEKEEKSETLR